MYIVASAHLEHFKATKKNKIKPMKLKIFQTNTKRNLSFCYNLTQSLCFTRHRLGNNQAHHNQCTFSK